MKLVTILSVLLSFNAYSVEFKTATLTKECIKADNIDSTIRNCQYWANLYRSMSTEDIYFIQTCGTEYSKKCSGNSIEATTQVKYRHDRNKFNIRSKNFHITFHGDEPWDSAYTKILCGGASSDWNAQSNEKYLISTECGLEEVGSERVDSYIYGTFRVVPD